METYRSTKLLERMHERLVKHKLKSYEARLFQIKHFRLEELSDRQLQECSLRLRQEALQGRALDDLLAEAYAIGIEAFWRIKRIRLYDVQIVAGIALHEGKLIEMQTGEGKTFAAVLPAYLNALTGKGVHVLTFNDYLARRDCEWLSPLFKFLGLSVGHIQEWMSMQDRQAAYAADITYSTAKQAGFDYLKDSICYEVSSLVQRPFHYAIVDEADSILLDEARIPLVIAGEEAAGTQLDWRRLSDIVQQHLRAAIDYETDDYKRNVYLTESGMDRVEALLHCGNLYDEENAELLASLHTVLHAEALLQRDVDYIVSDGQILLIDEFTGRVADKRHYPDGIHEAVEAKEGILSRGKGTILSSITLQHLMSHYTKLAGMTATAKAAEDDFRQTYCLEVVIIPPNQPCRRRDHPHLIYSHQKAKYQAMLKDIVAIHQTGRPILIGTSSVEESDQLANQLKLLDVECSVLNAKNDEMEAAIIACAGQYGAVTVSTNMAGRGVDIALGGGNAEEYEAVAKLGGLYVMGTSLHESIRIDHQLRGRAGRQGDPGSSRFYVSLEDELIQRYGIYHVIPEEYVNVRQDEPLKEPVIHKAIAHIQRVMVGQHQEIRATLNKYADIVEEQRQLLCTKRYQILTDQLQLSLLANRMPDKYHQVCTRYGELSAKKLEKRITLLAMDRCFADYLDYIAYVKEGIHLESISNKNPLDEFHRLIIAYYEQLSSRIEDRILSGFQAFELTNEEIDLDQEQLRVPSATWTYMINDRFFSNRINLF